jgi:hypothetical protein
MQTQVQPAFAAALKQCILVSAADVAAAYLVPLLLLLLLLLPTGALTTAANTGHWDTSGQ